MKNLSDFPPKLSPKMKMADAINQYHSLLTVLPRLNIPLGFGEKSIEQLCSEHHVSLPLFTLISRVYCQEDYYPTANELQQCPMADILQYLVSSHKDYLENKLPHIEHHLNILLEPMDRKYSTLITNFYAEFRKEMEKHFRYEEEVIFPYLRQILSFQSVAQVHTRRNLPRGARRYAVRRLCPLQRHCQTCHDGKPHLSSVYPTVRIQTP